MMTTKKILLIGSLLIAFSATAQLKITNRTAARLVVAVGFVTNGQHIAQGWTILESLETKVVIALPLKERYYYYYAFSATTNWSGNDVFLTGVGDFLTSFPADSNKPGLTANKFIRVDLGMGTHTSFAFDIHPPPPSNTRVVITQPVVPRGDHQTVRVD